MLAKTRRRINRHHNTPKLRRQSKYASASILSRWNSASGSSSISSPASSCRSGLFLAVAFQHLVEKRLGQIGAVIECRGAARHRAIISQQALQQRNRPRCCRNHRPVGSPPSRKANCSMSQTVLRVPPFRQLIAPGRIKLRAPQAIGLFRREYLGHAAIGPGEQALCGLEYGPPAFVVNGKQARDSFNHHHAGLVEGWEPPAQYVLPAVLKQFPAPSPAPSPIPLRPSSFPRRARRGSASSASSQLLAVSDRLRAQTPNQS